MIGSDVYIILRAKGVDTLHHANTVTTSCTFLRLGCLASRGHVHDRRLPQTPQYSDEADKRLGIWYDVFMDGVDIHARGSIRNNYGPVLFMLSATILLNLPSGTDVLVTRRNPVHGQCADKPADRDFMSPQELLDCYQYGDFGQHVVPRTQDGFLPLDGSPLCLLLDDPQCALYGGADAYSRSVQRLTCAANEGSLVVDIIRRQCRPWCRCLSGHKLSYDETNLEFWF